MRQNDKQANKRIALERIGVLFGHAQAAKDPVVAKRYVALARKLQMRFKVRMPVEFRYRFCKKCGAFWKPGSTVRVRTHLGKVVFTCLVCKAMRRKPYGKA